MGSDEVVLPLSYNITYKSKEENLKVSFSSLH